MRVRHFIIKTMLGNIKAVRIADQAPTDEQAAAVLPQLARKALDKPQLSDGQLLQEVLSSSTVASSGSLSSMFPSVQPRLVPVGQTFSSSARVGYGSGGYSAASKGAASPYAAEDCFRCGHGGHRNTNCKATKDRDNAVIPDGQLVKFAPDSWKSRYGYDLAGYKLPGR